MPRCPDCESSDVSEDVYSPEEKYDGQGFEWTVEHHYTCNRCGCEWTERFNTTREVEVNKHGKFFLDDNYCGRHIGSDELEEELKKLGYKVQQVTVCSNSNGYFSILRAEQKGEVSYLAVVSLDGEPICIGTVTLMINLPFKP